MEPVTPTLPDDDVAAIDRLGAIYKELSSELSKMIIGQQRVVELLSIALFSRGHALLMGVPGLAKTLLVSSVAKTLDLSFNRIQFTPDLMPADITGTDIIQDDSAGGKRQFEFIRGPVFANIVLADEINRAPAKTQSALLEAMQERRVTVMGRTFTLLPPFFVLATQNPIEQEGTYPLPEAQLDRFMFLIEVDYPTEEEEMRIARETTGTRSEELRGGNHLLPGSGAPRSRSGTYLRVCRETGARHPPHPGNFPGMGKAVCSLGRRPPRRPVPDSWGQDPRRSPGQLHRPQGRHRRHCGTCADAPRGHQLRRGIPGHHAP